MAKCQFEESITFYGDRQRDDKKRTALNVQYSKKENSNELTVNVEMAQIIGKETLWKSKVYLQLSKYELTSFCEILFGLRKKTEFNFHGKGKNKSLNVHNNGALGVMLVISEAGVSLKHLLNHDQRIELGAFVIRRQAMAWQVTVSDVLAILRQSTVISKTKDD